MKMIRDMLVSMPSLPLYKCIIQSPLSSSHDLNSQDSHTYMIPIHHYTLYNCFNTYFCEQSGPYNPSEHSTQIIIITIKYR